MLQVFGAWEKLSELRSKYLITITYARCGSESMQQTGTGAWRIQKMAIELLRASSRNEIRRQIKNKHLINSLLLISSLPRI